MGDAYQPTAQMYLAWVPLLGTRKVALAGLLLSQMLSSRTAGTAAQKDLLEECSPISVPEGDCAHTSGFCEGGLEPNIFLLTEKKTTCVACPD